MDKEVLKKKGSHQSSLKSDCGHIGQNKFTHNSIVLAGLKMKGKVLARLKIFLCGTQSGIQSQGLKSSQ